MNYYFCSKCLSSWHNNIFMSCCSGCKEHKHMNWSTQDMIYVYGSLIDFYGKAYFPSLYRVKAPCRKDFNMYNDFSKAIFWLDNNKFLLPGFVLQQKEVIKLFQRLPSKEHWDLIDPLVQHKVILKLKFKY